jgi:D-alanyl-lipoteichoic acid acyltransferase DltB (MBOAT superfamily)
MLFNSFVFIFAFLPIAYIVFGRCERRPSVLTFTGMFYGYWDARFCILMAFSTLVSYCAGLGFLRWSDPRRRKLCSSFNRDRFGAARLFKYANFGLQATHDLLHVFGADVQSRTSTSFFRSAFRSTRFTRSRTSSIAIAA